MKKLLLILIIIVIAACNNSNDQEGKVVTSSLSPEIVVPTYPATGTTVSSSEVTLKWGTIAPPSGTTFIVNVGDDPAHLKLLKSGLTRREYTLTIKGDGYYFWQVTAVNGNEEITGPLALFKVASTEPTISSIQLESPSLNEVVVDAPILLSWSGVTGVNYTLYIGDSVSDLKVVASNLTDTYYQFVPSHEGYYFWKVTADGGDGGVVESYLGFFRFSPVIANPQVIAPTYGIVITSQVINFLWKPVTGAVSYTLYLGHYPDSFTMEISNIADNNYTLSLSPEDYGYFFWKVRAVGSFGETSESSPGWFVMYDYLSPRQFKFVTSAMEGTKGGDICAIDSYNKVWCWGANTYRQLGVELLMDIGNYGGYIFYEEVMSTAPRLLPFPAGYSYKGVAVGIGGVYAITTDGQLWHLKYEFPNDVYFGLVPEQMGKDHSWSNIRGYYNHYCVVDELNRLWCWGDNSRGQLGSLDAGDGSEVPVKVDLPDDFQLIDYGVGNGFTCAYGVNTTTSKPVTLCWGDNSEGQLASDEREFSPLPITISALDGIGIRALKTGMDNVCVITDNYRLLCWGGNFGGKISSNLPERVYQPYEIRHPYGLKWMKVDPAPYNTCAIDEDDNLWCWGRSVVDDRDFSGYGSMMNTNISLSSPTLIKNGVNFEKLVSTPLARCGLLDNGKLQCWGDRLYGVLGDNYRLDARCSSPFYERVYNSEGTKWKMVAGGKFSTCAIDELNQLWCWGSNEFGSLGIGNDDTSVARGMPVKVTAPGVDGWKFVSMQRIYFNNTREIENILKDNGGTPVKDRAVFRCAISLGDDIYCWGNNENGEIGNGTSGGYVSYPGKVTGGHKWIAVSTGIDHACAIDIDHQLWCWGNNDHYQLGVTTIASSSVPVRVYFPSAISWSEITSVWDANCALSSEGKVFCWGWSGSGVTGYGSDVTMPVLFPDLSGDMVTRIAANFSQICALKDDGDIHCWGMSFYGFSPGGGKPSGVDYWTDVNGGMVSFCATDQDENVWCWGVPEAPVFKTYSGQITVWYGSWGSSKLFTIESPIYIPYLHNIRSLSDGFMTSCYVKNDGLMECDGRTIISDYDYNQIWELSLESNSHLISNIRASMGTRFRWQPVDVQFAQNIGDYFLYDNFFGYTLLGY